MSTYGEIEIALHAEGLMSQASGIYVAEMRLSLPGVDKLPLTPAPRQVLQHRGRRAGPRVP